VGEGQEGFVPLKGFLGENGKRPWCVYSNYSVRCPAHNIP
jgi:hypothetical protein